MTSTPSPTVRVSVPITPEVHEAFKKLASASGMSVGKAMGEWLGDTLEAIEFMAKKVQEARSAPKVVMREMHAYALGLADETGALMEKLTEEGKRARATNASASAGVPASRPPSGNTGGKGPQTAQGKHVDTPPRRASK